MTTYSVQVVFASIGLLGLHCLELHVPNIVESVNIIGTAT